MPCGTFLGPQSRAERRSRRAKYPLWGVAGTFTVAAMLAIAQQAPGPRPEPPLSSPDAIRIPDAGPQLAFHEPRPVTNAGFAAADGARQKQIADDSARLLELATQLKEAVDKTDKDTLSLNVIRKAELIEKLAKGVKEKMK